MLADASSSQPFDDLAVLSIPDITANQHQSRLVFSQEGIVDVLDDNNEHDSEPFGVWRQHTHFSPCQYLPW